ncbi:octopamine receptor 1-like [Actinia tenebrosa]|uniref:Octopamine receptor 1-like n=1 Tax=Actinia tenebrosa TaxID=6105 RepID=A0A6P8J0Y5_ACTTE|nr:octopamine receptor 1-like [Actinia tenebrosa]
MTDFFPSSSSSNLSSTNSRTFNSSTIFQVLERPKVICISLLLLFLMLSSIIGSLVICFTIFTTRRLHFAAYYFVASLAVSDLGVGIFAIPISLAYNLTFEMNGRWIFGVTACDIWILANFWFISASIFNLCAVTWDRYIAVTTPLLYASRMSTQCVIRMITGAWAFSLTASFINFYGLKTSKTRKLCEIQGLPFSFVMYSFVLIYLIPIITIVFVNAKLWVITTRQTSKIQAQIVSLTFVTASDTTQTTRRRAKQMKGNLTSRSAIKTFRTFLVLIGSFVCCMTPFFTVLLFASLFELPGFVLYVVVILTYMNSATNPWIYGISNKEFRKHVVSAFQKRFRRSSNVNAVEPGS